MPEITDDAWIDLMTVIHCATYKDGLLNIYYNGNTAESIVFHVRVALRAVGHKITTVKKVYSCGRNPDLELIDIYTTVTEEEGLKASRLYNTWIQGVEEIESGCNFGEAVCDKCNESDSDSDDESDSDSDNESVAPSVAPSIDENPE
jgi:hypothetical protein